MMPGSKVIDRVGLAHLTLKSSHSVLQALLHIIIPYRKELKTGIFVVFYNFSQKAAHPPSQIHTLPPLIRQ